MRSLLALTACLLIPTVAVAQYESAPTGAPPGYGPQGGYYGPPPGYAPPPAAEAPAPTRLTGFVLSTEMGYALPFGNADTNSSGRDEAMSDAIGGQVPIVFGAGYRFHPMVSVGGIFQYGFAQLKDQACPLASYGISCSGSDVRIGIEGRFHFLPDQMFSPWVSVGFGYNWFSIHMSRAGQSATGTIKGFELLNLETGGDVRVASIFTLGPFIGLRLQRWDSNSVSFSSGQSESGDIPSDNQTVHGWIAFGVRGAFTL